MNGQSPSRGGLDSKGRRYSIPGGRRPLKWPDKAREMNGWLQANLGKPPFTSTTTGKWQVSGCIADLARPLTEWPQWPTTCLMSLATDNNSAFAAVRNLVGVGQQLVG